MGAAAFKTFGYVGPTSNVRVSPDAAVIMQQMKAGYDEEEDKKKKKKMFLASTRTTPIKIVQGLKKKERRFIM
jgi:hypothetical protein